MTRDEMITAIDSEISRLEQVRDLLQHSASDRFITSSDASAPSAKKPRVLSPEARRSIAQGQKRRWAKQHDGQENAAAPETD